MPWMQAKAVAGLWLGPGVSPAAGLGTDGSSRWLADVLCFGGSSGMTAVYPSGLCSNLLVSLVPAVHGCHWRGGKEKACG